MNYYCHFLRLLLFSFFYRRDATAEDVSRALDGEGVPIACLSAPLQDALKGEEEGIFVLVHTAKSTGRVFSACVWKVRRGFQLFVAFFFSSWNPHIPLLSLEGGNEPLWGFGGKHRRNKLMLTASAGGSKAACLASSDVFHVRAAIIRQVAQRCDPTRAAVRSRRRWVT